MTDVAAVENYSKVSQAMRYVMLRQLPRMFWFTGLSGAGKSTLACALEAQLHAAGYLTYVLDGDNIRRGLCSDLKFSPADRTENMRRIAQVGKLFLDAGIICLAAFISPSQADREMVRAIIGSENFSEIYVRCPLSVCEKRDVKGNYKKARAGIIRDYTGVSALYEVPERPDLIINTDNETIENSVRCVLDYVLSRQIIQKHNATVHI